MNHSMKNYTIFWVSQSVSQLGSAMTGFALILWAYTRSRSALTISLMSFCNYVPYIIVSLFAGTFVDRHSKKFIMLAADSMAALCTLAVLVLTLHNGLQMGHIYLVNGIIGFMNAFQSPASAVAVGKLVPKEKIARVSGMNAFSNNLIAVLTPVLAASVYAVGGLKIILMIDLGSFAAAFVTLLLIRIPEDRHSGEKKGQMLAGCREGFAFLITHRGILIVILSIAVMNFFSRLTYENLLSPMLLARSGNDSMVLGTVNAVMGIAGIVGGILVSTGRFAGNEVRMIYIPAILTFLFGDMLMGMGRNVVVWSVAGAAANLPIPFINTGLNLILYQRVPEVMQGRVFAVRNALQFSTIPAGIFLGGFLADYVFEPFMQREGAAASVLHLIVGEGPGSGMAVMFLCTGIMGSVFSFICFLLDSEPGS